MKFIILQLFSLLSLNYLVNGQNKYELEFLDPKIFKPCEKYPDNAPDKLFDFNNIQIEQTEDGSLVMDGYILLKQTVEEPLPSSLETYKKERGSWQPTPMNQERKDFCVSLFDKDDIWRDYVKDTAEDQRKCNFFEAQKMTFDISEPVYLNLPMRNGEGEYKTKIEVGDKTKGVFICSEIPFYLHKV